MMLRSVRKRTEGLPRQAGRLNGPVMAYMKKVADATQNPSAGPGDGWFKIAEAGLISSSKFGRFGSLYTILHGVDA